MTGIVAVQWNAALRAQQKQRHDAWNAYARRLERQHQDRLWLNSRIKAMKAAA
jgi:hypothetical protein